jgi:hypothetical protein
VSTPSDEYRVGYGHPPLTTRWPKGQSGNRRGRKSKPHEGVAATIDRLLRARMQITLNGDMKTASALEAIILQLVHKSMAGNGRAYRVLLKYWEFANCNLDKKLELTFIDSDYTRAISSLPRNQGN